MDNACSVDLHALVMRYGTIHLKTTVELVRTAFEGFNIAQHLYFSILIGCCLGTYTLPDVSFAMFQTYANHTTGICRIIFLPR